MQDLIGYDKIIESSMRLVIYEAFKKIEKDGLQGKHYFIITFLTRFNGVSIPKSLMEKYPEEMTIAVQYQFRSLVVEKEKFKISLSFNGKFEKLTIPYNAVTSFADPSMNFALKFSMSYDENDITRDENQDFANKEKNPDESKNSIDLSAKVISLDDFRKKIKSHNSEEDS